MLDKNLIEELLVFSNDKPDTLKKIPRHEVVPNQFLPKKQNVGSESIGILVHEFIFGPNPTVNSDNEYPRKQ
jgi:hypothetical protein